MPKDLTKKQREILNYLVEYVHTHDYSPSYREIGENFNLSSPATVHAHVQALRRKGYLTGGATARSIAVSQKILHAGRAVQLPLVGFIAAGQPIEAIEQYETLTVPADLVRDVNSYVLKVKGDSMVDDGILDGDYVVVERNFYPKSGDIVVALLDNAYATLKRYYRERDRIRLQPANPKVKPIFAKNPTIQGIVRGVLRIFEPRSTVYVPEQ